MAVTPQTNGHPLKVIRRPARSISFDHVSFAYERNGPKGNLILDEITFFVQPGETLGILGETGAGKSTLLSLVPRFYDVNAGEIRVDGHDVRSLDLDDLRRNVGIVFQESFLFSNTVAANIAFGHPEATMESIERAARIASAEPFIRDLPNGYQTIVGEHGSNLSGGQRQRLAIARALLLDPPILLLDDATASVDAHTEHEIQEAMENARQGRTTLLVSNRISSLRRTDRIIVLKGGSIVQQGTHEELLKTPGYYRRLAELQFADLSDSVHQKL
jgi:ATP-binding cassette subfamily B protein